MTAIAVQTGTTARSNGIERAPRADCQIITAQPACVNLLIYEGDDIYLELAVTNSDGAPVDLSSAIVRSEIRTSADSENVVAAFDGSVDVEEPNVVLLHLSSAVNRHMPTSAVWDAEVEVNGSITTLVAGTVSITQEVTRP